jgi:hypothetical protein
MKRRLVDLTFRGQNAAISEASEWAARIFDLSKKPYVGIDAHEPSRYVALYEEFLAAHGRWQATGGERSKRVLVTTDQAWNDDIAREPAAFKKLQDWHREHDVELFRCDRSVAEDLARRAGIEGCEVCFWPELVALMWGDGDEPGSVRLRLFFPGKDALFERYHSYADAVVAAATPVSLN